MRPRRLDLLRRRIPRWRADAGARGRLGERARKAVLGVAHHPAEDLGRCRQRDELRAEPRGPRRRAGARAASVLPIAVVAARGRSGAPAPVVFLPARFPCSYEPIETCSAPWYAGNVGAAQASAGGRNGEQAADELLRGRADRAGTAQQLQEDGAPEHRSDDCGDAGNGSFALGARADFQG